MSSIHEEGWNEPGVEEFLTDRSKSASESSIRSYSANLGMIHRRSPGPLLQLSLKEARTLAAALKKELACADTLGRTAGLFYRFHEMKGHAEAFRIRRPKSRLSPGSILSPGDVNALMEAADNLRDKALVAILWESAARIHEVLAIDFADVTKVESEENGGRIFAKVWFKRAKVTGEERSCLLVEAAPHLFRWMDAYPLELRADAPIFISAEAAHYGNRLGYSGVRVILRKLSKKAGITKNVRPHIFRHSAITHLLRCGWSESRVKEAVGLTQGSRQLAIYSHLVDEDVDRARLEMHGLKAPEKMEETPLAPPSSEDLPALPAEGPFAASVRRAESRLADLVEKLVEEKLRERLTSP